VVDVLEDVVHVEARGGGVSVGEELIGACGVSCSSGAEEHLGVVEVGAGDEGG
jgi:translation initiation factor 6 (eIF-6)